MDQDKSTIIEMGNTTSQPQVIERVKVPEPLYNTREYYFYYFYLLLSVCYMFYTVMNISKESHPNYQYFDDRLSEGWMLNKKEDLSDGQFNSFRSKWQLILLVMLIHILLSKISQYFEWNLKKSGFRSLIKSPRLAFSLFFSTILLLALHGSSCIKLGILVSINYMIGKFTRRSKLNPILTWTFNVVALLISIEFSKLEFNQISEALAFLDEYRGILPRWHIHYNISTLRMISFNLDYYWSIPSHEEEHQDEFNYLNNTKSRTKYQLPSTEFTYSNYLAYVLYPPLYLAGPIITFNDFMYQIKFKNPNLTLKTVFYYLMRLIGCVLLMEFMLHTMYIQALCKSKHFEGYTPYELLMISFFGLKFIWLKLLIIWRFFRFWAMADGIDTIENMGRCMTNNYSVQGFWKGWHCSYNRWLVRYLYVPLGGAKYAFLNIWVIFTFVALWHDTSLDLLAWGWLIALFFLPEMIAVKTSQKWKNKPYYRHLRALGGTLNVLMLMTANLVGFALGWKGLRLLLNQLFNLKGLFDLFIFLSFLYADVQCMIEIRNHEFRLEYAKQLERQNQK